MPAASFAETSAIGKPVAFEARADEREVRGLISMMTTRPVFGSCAHWTLQPPMTPTDSTILNASRLSFSSSSLEIVRNGAAQKLSPVWTPTASMFSMKQTAIIWFFASRTTSTSSSSQSLIDSSMRHWWVRDASSPRAQIVRSSSML